MELLNFYGINLDRSIEIRFYLKSKSDYDCNYIRDGNPPHFHVFALFDKISVFSVLNCCSMDLDDLSVCDNKKVKKWSSENKESLIKIWDNIQKLTMPKLFSPD